jgi:hypothetical protein
MDALAALDVSDVLKRRDVLRQTESLTRRLSRTVENSASETAVSIVSSLRRAGATTCASSSAIN